MSQDEALERLLEGGSLLVTGMPGTGKSYWAAGLCKELEDQGVQITVITKTWASVANFNEHLTHFQSQVRAQTADHWANGVRRGAGRSDLLVIEEASMLNSHLWDEVAKAHWVIPQVLVLADFDQFGAIHDVYCGSPVRVSPETSDLLWELCQGHRLIMTENKRSDPELFEFVRSVRGGDLETSLARARELFPRGGPSKYTLCLSHATRMQENRRINLREKPEGAVFYEAPPSSGDNQPQSFWCWPGLELIGAGSGRIKKGIFYVVQSCCPEKVTLAGNGEILTLSAEKAVKCMRLSHCITYASCQGLSLDGVRLLDTESPHFTWRHLYVGASRCTSSRTLQVW